MVFVALTLLGLCAGSFVNALVYRLHEQSKGAKGLSIVNGRSICPHCKHQLAGNDLVPLLSWLELRGKCRYCSKPISWQYPAVEALSALLFALSYVFWPQNFGGAYYVLFGLWLVCLVLFLALLVYDLKWMILPDRLVFILIAVSGLYVLLQATIKHDPGVLLGSLVGVLCTAGLFYLIFQVSKGKWIGGGDVKLAVALGLLLGGPLASALMLFAASFGGTLLTLPLLATKKLNRNSHVPFGPFLIGATIIVFMFSASISAWYERLILGA